jgi:ribosomal protein S27E
MLDKLFSLFNKNKTKDVKRSESKYRWCACSYCGNVTYNTQLANSKCSVCGKGVMIPWLGI